MYVGMGIESVDVDRHTDLAAKRPRSLFLFECLIACELAKTISNFSDMIYSNRLFLLHWN